MKGFFLEWIPWIFNQTAMALDFTKRVVFAAYTEATVEKEWKLLHSVPIPLSSITFPGIPSEHVKWSVKLNPTEFIDSSGIKESSHISYLSLSILVGDITFDLTDWLNEVRWRGRVQPSPLELFTIWCCETGNSQFHLMDKAEVELITEQGDTIRQKLV